MNNNTTVEENDEVLISSTSLLSSNNQRTSQSRLLTQLYYPDTLYPDNYSFFADRRETTASSSSQIKSPIRMESHDQYPPTDPTIISTIPKQGTTEIEIVDHHTKYHAPMIDRERGELDSDKRKFDVKRYIPSALRTQDKTQPPGVLLDPRFYSMKKTSMTIMCLLIIIMSNSVQLKHVLKEGSTHFYGTQVTLGIISVLMCATIGFYLMYVITIDDQDVYKQRKSDFLQNLGLIFLFALFILNIIFAIFHAI